MSHHGPARHYRVAGKRFDNLNDACGRAVALGIERRESVAIEAFARGRMVELIDVTAKLSIDVPTTDNDPTEEG